MKWFLFERGERERERGKFFDFFLNYTPSHFPCLSSFLCISASKGGAGHFAVDMEKRKAMPHQCCSADPFYGVNLSDRSFAGPTLADRKFTKKSKIYIDFINFVSPQTMIIL
jgi:hypothetical protein